MRLNFEDIMPGHKEAVEKHIQQWELENSEYTFTNLLMWGRQENIQLAFENNTLFIQLTYGGKPPIMLAPLTEKPERGYHAAVEAAASHLREQGIEPVFSGICGKLKTAFEKECPDYRLTQDRDNHDYIYNASDLINLKGKKFHGKRNHLNQFRAANPGFEYVQVNSDMVDECMNVYEQWVRHKEASQPGVLGERRAILTVLKHMDYLGVKGGGIRLDGQLAAFSLGQPINERMAVIHIEKALAGIPGLYAAINQQFVEHEWSQMELINREEDMGLEGLRRAKLSYHPVMLLEKFEARKAGE